MTPTTPAEMRGHLLVATPDGHGMDTVPADMPMADMASIHDAKHSADTPKSGHSHSAGRSHESIGFEIRTAEMWPDADYEMRATSDGLTLDGYAAVFNLPSLPMSFPNVGGGKRFREVIHPGAFTRSLNAKPDMTLRYQHNLTTLPLGRTKSGTMELSEDDRGLRVRATLPDNEWGRPIRDAIARGDISGMSFRFAAAIDEWEQTADGNLRHLREVKLGPEVSITDYPAYPDTSVAVRHLAEAADLDTDALAEAFRALRDPDAKLTAEQHDVLMAAVNARTDAPYIGPRLAQARERLAALAL